MNTKFKMAGGIFNPTVDVRDSRNWEIFKYQRDVLIPAIKEFVGDSHVEIERFNNYELGAFRLTNEITRDAWTEMTIPVAQSYGSILTGKKVDYEEIHHPAEAFVISGPPVAMKEMSGSMIDDYLRNLRQTPIPFIGTDTYKLYLGFFFTIGGSKFETRAAEILDREIGRILVETFKGGETMCVH